MDTTTQKTPRSLQMDKQGLHSFKRRHPAGFASTLYVLALAILLLGGIVAALYPTQVKNRSVASQLRRQAARSQMEVDAYNLSKGAVSQIALGMEDPSNLNLAEHSKLQNSYSTGTKGPAEQIARVSEIHKTRSKSLIISSGERDPTTTPMTQINTMGNPQERSFDISTVFGPLNVGYSPFVMASDTDWGSIRFADSTFSGSSPFNANASAIGLPVLHPNYTYGLGHPGESQTNYTIRNTGTFQSPSVPINLNKFSGWGFYVNPRATNGFALYPPEFFPGLAVGTDPMLGRLHMYRFDRVLPIGTAGNPESIKYRIRVMLMEVPYQGALEYEGELRVDNSRFWQKSSIKGLLASDKVVSAGGSLATGSKVLVSETGTSTVNINGTAISSADLIKTGTRDLQTRKNTNNLGETGTMVRSFLINPATFGVRANRRNWFEWPVGLSDTQWFSSASDTNTAGGPTLDQYSCGVLQTDTHLRVDKTAGGTRLRIRIYKIRSNSNVDLVGTYTTGSAPTMGSGYSGSLQTCLNLDNPGEIRVNLQDLVNGMQTSLGASINTTNRQWPIRGISVYKDPTSTWTLNDPTVILTNGQDLNKFHEGLAIISQFNLRISQDLNTQQIPSGRFGLRQRYIDDAYLPAGPHFIPMAIYAPNVGYFEAGGSERSALSLTGSISQRGTAPFLPPTSSGTNPVIDNRTSKITSSGAPILDVYGGTMNNYETIKIEGIRHQVQLPPIVPIRWLVTYLIEEQNE